MKLRKSEKLGYFELVSKEGVECYLTLDQVQSFETLRNGYRDGELDSVHLEEGQELEVLVVI